MGDNGNNVQKVNDDRKVSAELFTEEAIRNVSAISKGTARKSFNFPAKKNYKLSRILHKLNGKMAPKKISSPKKPRAKSTEQMTKPVIDPNPPTQFPHDEGYNTSQNRQPVSTEPQFSDTPHQQPFSNSSHFDIRQLFPTPDKEMSAAVQSNHRQLLTGSETPQKLTNSNSVNNLSSPSPNGQQFLPSSTSQKNQRPLSDIAAIFPANATSSTTSINDNFDEFSRNMKTLLQNLPFKKTLRVHQKIIALVMKECGVSSDDEFDSMSLSSDE